MSLEMIWVVALPCEARPLIDRFKLKKTQEIHAFAFYRNPALRLTLIESGVGIINAAAATAFAASRYPNDNLAFINIGIAGAFDTPIGDLRLVNKVSNEQGHSIYPMALSSFRMQSAALVTLTRPALAKADALVDMEGFAFYQAATRFTPLELIHSLKVISDNQHQDFSQLNKNQITSWIAHHLDTIEAFLSRLKKLALQLPVKALSEKEEMLIKKLSAHFHLTQYQQHQVKVVIKKMVEFGLTEEALILIKERSSFKQWLETANDQVYQYALGIF